MAYICQSTFYMRQTFEINFVDGHLLIRDNGNTILIDTGSPVTVHSGNVLNFLGREFAVSTSIMGSGVGNLCELSGVEFDTLLGMDIMSQYKVIFDYGNSKLTFLSEDEADVAGTAYPLMDVMGVKALEMRIGGKALRMAIDTGAPLSYVDTAVTAGMEPVGEREDFHPLAGRYVTRIFKLDAEFAGKQFPGTYGNLPGLMGMSLKLGGLDGVVGYDFFKSFKVMFDFRDGVAVVGE